MILATLKSWAREDKILIEPLKGIESGSTPQVTLIRLRSWVENTREWKEMGDKENQIKPNQIKSMMKYQKGTC
jgi:hypothetical protein